MAKKYALLIANSEYRDNGISNLVTPLKNLEIFRSVLEDPDIGGIDPSDITALENQPMGEVRKAVSDFFSNRSPGDFLLLYFTGHGFRGDDNLYLAVSDTEKEKISATGIPDFFINGEIRKCRAKQQVVILDCCYSGFFSSAGKSHPNSTVVVLTASDRNELAWEKEGGSAESVNSLYTRYLVQGLKTGEPDRDGWITVSELHRYLCDKLETSKQNPLKIVPFSREATDIRIAKNLVALVNDARKRELNEAYAEAIQTWEKILEMRPGHPEAPQALKRLREQTERGGKVKNILQKLTMKLTEISDIFNDIARYLKQMEKEGIDDDGEIFMGVANSYSLGNIPAETFIDYWKKTTSKQQVKQAGPDYEALAQRLNRGEIIAFFGSGAIHHFEPSLPGYDGMVEQLALNARYKDFKGCLPMISQYYQMTQYGRPTLLDKYKDITNPECKEFEVCRLYEILSETSDPVIVISTSYGDRLEQVFREKNRKYVLITHKIPLPGEDETGTPFIARYSDKEKPDPPCTADDISSMSPLEKGYSIIYKIRGTYSLFQGKPGERVDTLMITDEDYFSFSKHIKKLIPSYLGSQFEGRSLVFLGYNLDKWHDRLIAGAVLEKRRSHRERYYAVTEAPTQYEQAFWKYKGVDIFQEKFETFVKKLADAFCLNR